MLNTIFLFLFSCDQKYHLSHWLYVKAVLLSNSTENVDVMVCDRKEGTTKDMTTWKRTTGHEVGPKKITF